MQSPIFLRRSAILLSAVIALRSSGTLIIENFSGYGNSDIEDINGLSGGSGWSSSWINTGGTAAPRYDWDQNITFANSGYDAGDNIAVTNNGRLSSASADNPGVVVNRDFTALSGTIWISMLVRHASDTVGDALLWFETPGSPNGANTFVGLRAGDLVNLRYGGTNSSGSDLNSAGSNLLFLTRITIDESGVNDRIEFWIKKEGDSLATEGDLGAAMLSNSGSESDLFGTGLNNLGVSGGNDGIAGFDAIRISNSATGFTDVMMVPEPAGALLILIAGTLLALEVKRRR